MEIIKLKKEFSLEKRGTFLSMRKLIARIVINFAVDRSNCKATQFDTVGGKVIC